MNRALAYLGTIGVGAVGMYLLDPTWGGHRRNHLRSRVMNGVTASSDGITTAAREMAHRMESMLDETRARLGAEPLPREVQREPLRREEQTLRLGAWSPAIRLLAGGLGAAFLGYCVTRRDSSTAWLGFVGTGLLMRATVRQL